MRHICTNLQQYIIKWLKSLTVFKPENFLGKPVKGLLRTEKLEHWKESPYTMEVLWAAIDEIAKRAFEPESKWK